MTDTRDLIITIPLDPPSILSINSSANRYAKARATSTIRNAAKLATLSALSTKPFPSGANPRISFAIAWSKGRKRMDDDNLYSMCKAMRDGVADALAIDDRHFINAGISQRRDPEGIGHTTIRLTPSEDHQ